MKLLLKILFFLIAIFQTNIIESKNILISEVIALELKTSDIYIQQNEKIEVLNVILKNDFGITCKSDLVVYRNWGTSVEAIAAKESKSFVQFSSKTGITKGGQSVFSYQARFPKPNLNIRLDRGFRAPFKNTTSPYLGKPYNGFNTHINIQKPGSFNYHFPINPLKWKYYNIP